MSSHGAQKTHPNVVIDGSWEQDACAAGPGRDNGVLDDREHQRGPVPLAGWVDGMHDCIDSMRGRFNRCMVQRVMTFWQALFRGSGWVVG